MNHRGVVLMLVGLLSSSVAMAQQNGGDKPDPCFVTPAFHCVQSLTDGTLLAHFGYSYFCPDGSKPKLEKYIDIGKDNLFTPGSKDRGQSEMFLQGKHVDVFQVELTPEEVKKQVRLTWKVLDRAAQLDYSATADADLDCTKLPK